LEARVGVEVLLSMSLFTCPPAVPYKGYRAMKTTTHGVATTAHGQLFLLIISICTATPSNEGGIADENAAVAIKLYLPDTTPPPAVARHAPMPYGRLREVLLYFIYYSRVLK
jgi:hypothetical protein